MKHLFLLALMISLTFPFCTYGGQKDRPNILYIMADDLGWKDVGYHGSEIKTPHIDHLAKGGVRLERFYVMPVCSPTRAALMTGRYPIRYGLQTGVVRPWAQYGLPLDEYTLAQGLNAVGYYCAMVGKWHLGTIEPGYLPTRRGFDHHYGHYLGAIDYFTHMRMGGLDWHRNEKALREKGYTTNLMGAEGAKIIRKHDFKKQPLFLYVAFNAPHTPLQAPEEYLKKYDHITKKKRRAYAAMVTCMDDAIGNIVSALEKAGQMENTIIIFCSDNGGPITLGANNGSLRGSKGTLYEGGVRVVAFVHWRGRLKGGTTNESVMHIVDWFPTLTNLAGAKLHLKHKLDGLDIWPTITLNKPSPHEEILLNAETNRGALLQWPWKILAQKKRRKAKKKTIELYDLSRDPGEQNNLAEKNPAKTKALLKRLEYYTKAARPALGGKGRLPKGYKAPKIWGEVKEAKQKTSSNNKLYHSLGLVAGFAGIQPSPGGPERLHLHLPQLTEVGSQTNVFRRKVNP